MSIKHELDKLPITKLDAARRQLDTAITLWFHDADPVSLHTLTAAAHGIIHDIGSKIGKPTMLLDPGNFRKETFGEYKTLLRKAQNFFKHANDDPVDMLFFSPQATAFHLFDAVQGYYLLSTERTPLMTLFWSFYVIRNPHYFETVTTKGIDFRPFYRLTKKQYFIELLPVFTRSGAG
jgi:hypothetical protein